MGKIYTKLSGDTVVCSATSDNGLIQKFAYDGNLPISKILNDVSQATGWNLEPVYLEIQQRFTERSTEFGAGMKLGVSVTEGKLEFEKRPKEEVETIGKIIWRKPES